MPVRPLVSEPEPTTLMTRWATNSCRFRPCPGSTGPSVWNSTSEQCECTGVLSIRPLEPESTKLATRSVLPSCRPLICPLGAHAFWDPMVKKCMCPTLPKMPIPRQPAMVSMLVAKSPNSVVQPTLTAADAPSVTADSLTSTTHATGLVKRSSSRTWALMNADRMTPPNIKPSHKLGMSST